MTLEEIRNTLEDVRYQSLRTGKMQSYDFTHDSGTHAVTEVKSLKVGTRILVLDSRWTPIFKVTVRSVTDRAVKVANDHGDERSIPFRRGYSTFKYWVI